MLKPACMLGLLIGCGGGGVSTGVDGAIGHDTLGPDGPPVLDPTPGTYRQTCDGSAALALDFNYFIDLNDEDQSARIFRRGDNGAPVQGVDVGSGLGLAVDDEADLEAVTRVDTRIFVSTSHGRKSSGNLDRARYRFGALDVSGTAPSLQVTVAGVSTQLLDQMLVAANWDTPNNTVLAALDASSKLDDSSEASLAPEMNGTNIEGLTALPSGSLLFGLRNPRPGNKAIVVSLVNPDAVIAGQTARFGGAAELDLGGLGIRSLEWSAAHAAVLIIAGPHATGGPFKLYRWSGKLDEQPTLVTDLAAPALHSPEAVVPYPGTRDVQIIYDMGDADVAGVQCKDAPAADRRFTDAIVHVD